MRQTSCSQFQRSTVRIQSSVFFKNSHLLCKLLRLHKAEINAKHNFLFLKMAQFLPLFSLFLIEYKFTTNKCENNPSSIRIRTRNLLIQSLLSLPLGQVSCPSQMSYFSSLYILLTNHPCPHGTIYYQLVIV